MGHAPRLRILDRREAIRRALEEAGEGDVVLLAGKGHETYQLWGSEVRRSTSGR
jgi:UDP-N-acetylmuramoyl-L-alanyl-D-glutamate--2,6-diaminopimelate ligase